MNLEKRGFTLIELMIVISIIGILATVTVTSLSGARSSSRDSERATEIGQLILSLGLFHDSCKAYPSATGGLTLDDTVAGCPSGITFATFARSGIPTEPGGAAYGYASDGTNAVVSSTLENSTFNALTEDLDGTVLGVACNDPVYCKSP